MNRLLAMAWSTNTLKTYATGWQAFSQFLQHGGHALTFPVTVHVVREFVAWLSLRRLTSATISTYVAGVSHFHKINGFQDPTKDFIITKLLEGTRRAAPKSDTRLPISLPILQDILGALPLVCTTQYEVTMFRAAFLCAFFGFMRVGEFTANSKLTIQPSALRVGEVRFCHSQQHGHSVEISSQCSKSNQLGPPQIIRLAQAQNLAFCPVAALHKFLTVRPKCQGILFCHFDGGPLTRFQFGSVLQKAIGCLGMEGLNFKSHSLRIGAATTAFELGIPISDIQNLGRWRSEAVVRYIRPHRL